MMMSHAIQALDRQSHFSGLRTTALGRPMRARGVKVLFISEGESVQVARRAEPEPVGSIEDAIRRYIEMQPAQLYRGGA